MTKPYPHQNKEGVLVFDQAVKDCFEGYAKENGFKLEKLQECQWALWNKELCFKIYLPDGHQFPINETVAPEFSREWFGGNEIPLIIFYRFIGRVDHYKNKGLERYSLEEIPGRVNELKGYFTEIRKYFDQSNRKALWENILELRRQQLQNSV